MPVFRVCGSAEASRVGRLDFDRSTKIAMCWNANGKIVLAIDSAVG